MLVFHRLTVFSGNSKSAEGNLVGVRPPSRHHLVLLDPFTTAFSDVSATQGTVSMAREREG
jgi:hypothetical protein